MLCSVDVNWWSVKVIKSRVVVTTSLGQLMLRFQGLTLQSVAIVGKRRPDQMPENKVAEFGSLYALMQQLPKWNKEGYALTSVAYSNNEKTSGNILCVFTKVIA